MDFAIGIVLYNGEKDKIKRIISEYSLNNISIIIVDNGSKNIEDIKDVIEKNNNVIFIRNHNNEGIAKALNQILNETQKIQKRYLLTLDQDSFLEYKDLLKMKEFIKDDVAIVCPEIIDLNKKNNKLLTKDYIEVSRCITSGSLMNMKICNEIGNFDEKMFIDYVDFDYCKRIIINKYKIIKVKGCFLKHEIGKRTCKKFLWLNVYPTNHASNRVYYYFRNMHYYFLKYKKNMTINEKLNEIIRIIWKYISIVLYEDNKKEKLNKARKGFKDAKNM